ncbi:MAG: helix-turn-helix domain-containing protein [Thermacetogeniaceae bacterium]
MAIKSRLHMLMAEKKMNMSDLARETGISRTTIWSLYHDKSTKIDFNTLDALCRYFKCQPGDVLVYVEDESEGERREGR